MQVIAFDIVNGVYAFEFSELDTSFHSHPAIEILFSKSGSITLSTETQEHHDLSFAIIDSNLKHKVSTGSGAVNAIMMEHRDVGVKRRLTSMGYKLQERLFVQKGNTGVAENFEAYYQELKSVENESGYDERVQQVISHLAKNDLEYGAMMNELTEVTSLSESRLSHLFKQNVGISLKKYLLWCKLRATIGQFLNQKENLFAALIQSGFYDQPHFSKAFKTMLGIQPSRAYNSRTVQF